MLENKLIISPEIAEERFKMIVEDLRILNGPDEYFSLVKLLSIVSMQADVILYLLQEVERLKNGSPNTS